MSKEATTSEEPRIFILYNAKASFLGKITYGYRKLTCPPTDSPCAACDLTHGGLKLDESKEWKASKNKIPAQIVQLHQDELTPELRQFTQANDFKFPAVLGRTGGKPFEILLTSRDLATVSKDHSAFTDLLKSRMQEHNLPWSESSRL